MCESCEFCIAPTAVLLSSCNLLYTTCYKQAKLHSSHKFLAMFNVVNRPDGGDVPGRRSDVAHNDDCDKSNANLSSSTGR